MVKYFKVLRPWQWTKNLLVFIPFLLGSKDYGEDIFVVFSIFLLFSIFVSSTYIFNDIKDINLDKYHPKKKFRPIASGDLDVRTALYLGLFIFTLSFISAYLINSSSAIFFLIYAILTYLYTSKFKYIFMVDTLLISLMFVIRILIGGASSNVEITFYLLCFIFFTSCLLSFSKKISIVNTEGLGDNKFFLILKQQNQKFSFRNLYIFFSVLSSSSLIFWFLNLNADNLFVYKQIMLLGTMLSYFIFLYFVYNLSTFGKLEDFSSEIIKNKILFILSILIIASFCLGYF